MEDEVLVGMIQVLQPNGVTSLSDYDGVTRYLDIKTGCGMCFLSAYIYQIGFWLCNWRLVTSYYNSFRSVFLLLDLFSNNYSEFFLI